MTLAASSTIGFGTVLQKTWSRSLGGPYGILIGGVATVVLVVATVAGVAMDIGIPVVFAIAVGLVTAMLDREQRLRRWRKSERQRQKGED
jgi:ABC-type Fe2+-enterobactin transport system substrate-binding protein